MDDGRGDSHNREKRMWREERPKKRLKKKGHAYLYQQKRGNGIIREGKRGTQIGEWRENNKRGGVRGMGKGEMGEGWGGEDRRERHKLRRIRYTMTWVRIGSDAIYRIELFMRIDSAPFIFTVNNLCSQFQTLYTLCIYHLPFF